MGTISVFENKLPTTPINLCNKSYLGNQIYVKRDDLLPFSFGGNKVRKAQKFYDIMQKQNVDYVVTYGSSSSNHCRIIANMATAMGIGCCIICPEENYHETANTKIIHKLGASIEYCPVNQVKETINKAINRLSAEGYSPYFIMGGGHGNPGTEAYVEAYREIMEFEEQNNVPFDYIFHASGTGATQSGLLAGQLLFERLEQKIVGISIARLKEPGGNVVLQGVIDYMEMLCLKGKLSKERKDMLISLAKEKMIFTDAYRLDGYGSYHEQVVDTIREVEALEGFSMDTTYVGKAFWGMKQYLQEKNISGKNILFIHTGGTPLYFTDLN